MNTNLELMWHLHTWSIPAALSLLPGKMNSMQARAQMLAIGLHESGFIARQQHGTATTPGHGPAKSFWQFEKSGGVQELLDTPTTRIILAPICDVLGYPRILAGDLHEAMEHNDTLAAVMCRLLLWKDPRLMPERHESSKGYAIYLARWRPNAAAATKHAHDWPANFKLAWETVIS
jgi:hypothetical protein